MNSIVSFPERGPYGKPSYPGNASGYVVRELLRYYKPGLFCDPAEGSGTSRDVARELGIKYYGFDLRGGFDLLKHDLLKRLPRTADYIFFHPPYYDIIVYSGKVWGQPVRNDLSRCNSPEEFLEKIGIALLNIYNAVSNKGNYSVMVGDVRNRGNYWSLQSDIVQIAPGRLEGIVIKAQHNCTSMRNEFAGKFIPIFHEYILNFRKDKTVVSLLGHVEDVSRRLSVLYRATWKSIVETALIRLGGAACLPDIYDYVSSHADENKLRRNSHWKEKIRQVLQRYAVSSERGIWRIAADAPQN